MNVIGGNPGVRECPPIKVATEPPTNFGHAAKTLAIGWAFSISDDSTRPKAGAVIDGGVAEPVAEWRRRRPSHAAKVDLIRLIFTYVTRDSYTVSGCALR